MCEEVSVQVQALMPTAASSRPVRSCRRSLRRSSWFCLTLSMALPPTATVLTARKMLSCEARKLLTVRLRPRYLAGAAALRSVPSDDALTAMMWSRFFLAPPKVSPSVWPMICAVAIWRHSERTFWR